MLQPLSCASGSNSLASSQHLWDLIFKWHNQLLENVYLLNAGDGTSSLQRRKLTIGSKASTHVSRGFAIVQRALVSAFSRLTFPNDAVSCSLRFTLRWSHYVPCSFFHTALVSILRKLLYKSLKFLAGKIGRHLEKKQHHLSPSKVYFCFMSILFPKAYIQVLLSHEPFLSKSVWIIYGLSSIS